MAGRYSTRPGAPIMERIEERLHRIPEAGCWIFDGPIHKIGYVQIHYNRRNRYIHNVMYELHYGDIPDGMEVCHRCDVRACCNPRHLFLATHKDNMADMSRKGRGRKTGQRGQTHSSCKTTDDKVRAIISARMNGSTIKSICEQFSVSECNVKSYLYGTEGWKWLRKEMGYRQEEINEQSARLCDSGPHGNVAVDYRRDCCGSVSGMVVVED